MVRIGLNRKVDGLVVEVGKASLRGGGQIHLPSVFLILPVTSFDYPMESKDKKKEKGKINVKEYLSKNKGIFTRELKKMMYGFGDVINPDTDSVECMEDLLMEFITEMCLEASKVSAPRVRVKTEDFLFVLRHDEKKLARAEELLIMAKDIARARKLIAEGTEVAYTAKE